MNNKSKRLKSLAIIFLFSFVFLMCTQGKETVKPADAEKRVQAETKSTAKTSSGGKNSPKSDSKKDNKSAAAKGTASTTAAKNINNDADPEDEDEDIPFVSKASNSVLLTGDILIEDELLHFMDDFGYNYPIEKLAPVLDGYDIVFSNLETPIGTRGRAVKGKPYCFLIHPNYAEPIKRMHLDVVSIANNHIMDYGETALQSTIKWLNNNNIKYTGAGNNLDEARKPAIIMRQGIEFVFLAYNERPPASFYAGKDTPGTTSTDLEEITKDIKKHKKKNNLVMVSMHWGIESTLYPQTAQIVLARAILDAGADCIIGHHPHWIQGVEIYKKKPIFYSLGNLINGFYNRIEQDGFVAVLRYKGLKLRRVEIIPIAGQNSLIDFQPYRMTGKEADEHLTMIGKISARFRTRVIIKNHTGYIYMYDE